MTNPLAGRRALVTGASSGLGAATAALLSREGTRIALLGRDERRLTEVARTVEDAVVLVADVASEQQVVSAVQAAADSFDGLDIVVNAAGVNRAAPFTELGVAHLRDMIATNLLGPMLVTHAALPHLLESPHADLVNVSSMSARRVLGTESAVYAATKAALTTWTAALSEELGARGVRVMTLSPGIIDTPFATHTVDSSQREVREAHSRAIGLPATDVAEQLIAMLRTPRHVRIHEVAVVPTAQRP